MRVFAAVEVTDAVIRNRIAAWQREVGTGKAVEPHNLHFTLHFMGEIQPKDAEAAAEALKLVKFEAFDVRMRGAGVFGRPPRVVWAGTDPRGGQSLSSLADAVRDALGSPDRPFKPHLTVLRMRGRSVDVTGHAGREWGVQRVDTVKLKQSVLGPEGPAYTDLAAVVAR